MKSLIIDRPEKRSLQQRYGDNGLKIFLAFVSFYIWVPAITSGAWYIAYTFYNQQILLLEGYKEYHTSTSLWYIAIIVTMMVLVMAWSKGNKSMAAGRKRKYTGEPLTLQESSLCYGVGVENLTGYRTMKNMIVSFDKEDRIAMVQKTP